MQKYFRIGEISELYNIGTDSLRYYEKLGILKPKRGENDYRMYSTDDIWRLNVIRDLRELGFSMERIQKYLDNRTVETTEYLLREELKVIRKKMESLYLLQKNVQQRLDTITMSKQQKMGEIEVKKLGERTCFFIPEGYRKDEEMDVLIKQLMNRNPDNLYIVGNNQVGSVIPLRSARKGKYRDYKAVFMMDEHGDYTIAGGDYLTISYRGESEQTTIYLAKLLRYIEQKQLKPIGDILEFLWIDIHIAQNVSEHITQLQVKVEY